MKHSLIILFSFFLFVGCEKEEINRIEEEDQLLSLAYNNNYLYPEEFYQESIGEGSVYYENTVSIKPIPERESIWIELSTNDKEEARRWSNKSNEYSSVNREIISESETEKYFEFQRQNVNNDNDILFSRIHKTNYFQPSLDKFKEPEIIGVYNYTLEKENVKELIEYLWINNSLGFWHSKVLKSQIVEHDTYYEYYIQSIQIVYGDWGLKDVVYVYDSFFKLDKTERTLTFVTSQKQEMEGN